MTLHPPRYSLPPPSLRPHSSRVGVVLWTTFRERLSVLNVVLVALIFVVVLLQIVVPFYFSSLVGPTVGVSAASIVYLPFESNVWFFFEVLFLASIASGVISNDVATRAVTMYLARPITRVDYLVAKSAGVALWLGIAVILPGVVGMILILGLGYVSFPLALQFAAGYLGVGLLTVGAFGGLALLLSALAPKSSYAGAGIFGLLVGAEIVASALLSISGESSVLYASPQEDVLAVARSAFGVTGGDLNPLAAALLLVAVAVVTLALAYRRIAAIDGVSE